MQKHILSLFLVFLLLLCGCSQNVQLNDTNLALEKTERPEDSTMGGNFITIHTPDETPVDEDVDVSDQANASASDITSESPPASVSGDTSPSGTAEDPEDKNSEQSAQVPIYPVDGDKNFGSDHSIYEPDNSAEDAPIQGEDSDAQENHTEASDYRNSEEADDSQKTSAYDVTAYVMNTVYNSDTGENMLDLRINTPVIDAGSSEAELLFNRYFSSRSLEYALYINETVYPELQQTLTEEEDIRLSFAAMDYSVLYNSDGYLCVMLSYTEDLPDRYEERASAALFDMKNAVLEDEWDVSDANDLPESVREIINATRTDTADDAEQVQESAEA